MKTIEKSTRDGDPLFFEILTSRKELQRYMADELSGGTTDGEWDCEDTTISFYTKDGEFHSISYGDKVPARINTRNIEKYTSDNGSTTVIYGDVPLVYNDHYGDWEIDFSPGPSARLHK